VRLALEPWAPCDGGRSAPATKPARPFAPREQCRSQRRSRGPQRAAVSSAAGPAPVGAASTLATERAATAAPDARRRSRKLAVREIEFHSPRGIRRFTAAASRRDAGVDVAVVLLGLGLSWTLSREIPRRRINALRSSTPSSSRRAAS
jgi:hypothetical protein